MNNITDSNKEFWNKKGKEDTFFTAGDPFSHFTPVTEMKNKYRNRTEFKHLVNKVKLKGKVVLDLGCGTGRLSFRFAKKCKKVIGVDFAPAMIEQAKKYKKDNNIQNTEFYVSNLQDFRIDEKVDVIYLGGVLMCIEDDDVRKIISNFKNFINSETIIINRDTTALAGKRLNSKIFPKRTDYAVYRTSKEIKDLFKDEYDTFYESETYPVVIPFNLYNRLSEKAKNNKLVLFFVKIGLHLQSFIFDPFLLKNKWIYKSVRKNWEKSERPIRQFYYFHKLKKK